MYPGSQSWLGSRRERLGWKRTTSGVHAHAANQRKRKRCASCCQERSALALDVVKAYTRSRNGMSRSEPNFLSYCKQ